MDTKPKVDGVEEAEVAPVVKDEGGKSVAAISPNSTKPQRLNASESSELGQSNAIFRPGAIATESEVSIEEGVAIVDAKSKQDLGLEEDYVPYSKPVNISSSTDIDGTVPLSVALEMNENLSLSAGLGKIFIAIYILETKTGPKLGIVPTSDISVNDLIASFDFTTEGTYTKASFQLAAFEFSGALDKEIESSRSVVTKEEGIEQISEAEDEVSEPSEEGQITDSQACPENIDASKFVSSIEICGITGTLDLSNLKAENIISGQTIAGVSGSFTICDSDAQKDCVSSSSFPAVDSTNLAAKVVAGQTLAGIEGSAANTVYSECTAANQEGCVATDTYKTIDLSSKDAGGALDLTDSNFATRVASSSSFEYWDENGARHTNTGDADLLANNIKSGVNILGTSGTTDPLNCASISAGTWISVPGDPDYGTNDFCVMKYEAKNNSGSPTSTAANTPWVSIGQHDAITECASLGKGYHLITNDEWMTIAANLANVASNWSGNTLGAGQLYVGHTDDDPANVCAADSDDNKAYVETNCTAQAAGGTENDENTQRRTMTLSNGEVIWDLSGNAREWVDYFNDEEKPTPNDGTFREFTAITETATLPLSDMIPTNAVKSFWDDTWDSSQGVGQGRMGTDSSGGALTRGRGYAATAVQSGIFSLRLDNTYTNTSVTLGFRCTVSRP